MNSASSSSKDDAAVTADVGSETARDSSTRVSSSSALVPQLGGITQEDLTTAIRVLDAISSLDPKKGKRGQKQIRQRQKRKCNGGASTTDDASEQPIGGSDANGDIDDGGGGGTDSDDGGLARYRQSDLRNFRKSLSACLSLHQRTMYKGKSEAEYCDNRLAERTLKSALKRQKMAERAQQRKYVESTDLRKGRVDRLES